MILNNVGILSIMKILFEISTTCHYGHMMMRIKNHLQINTICRYEAF